jgi:hypothetical protein
MSMLGACWKQAKGQRPKWKIMVFLGKKACTSKEMVGRKHNMRACKESNSWKEEKHARMGGRPNDDRVRVLVRYCKWLKSPKCINIDT